LARLSARAYCSCSSSNNTSGSQLNPAAQDITARTPMHAHVGNTLPTTQYAQTVSTPLRCPAPASCCR
jgi:hypothetical protein